MTDNSGASPLTVKEAQQIGAAYEDATKKMRIAAGQGMQAADALHASHEANVQHQAAVKELQRIQERIAKQRNNSLEDIVDWEREGSEFTGVVFGTKDTEHDS